MTFTAGGSQGPPAFQLTKPVKPSSSNFVVALLLTSFGLLNETEVQGADAKCKQCKASSRIAQLLAGNQFAASTLTAPAVSDKQPFERTPQ